MCRQALESSPPEAMSAVRAAKAAREQIHDPVDIGCTYLTTADQRQRRHQREPELLESLLVSRPVNNFTILLGLSAAFALKN
jgi:hypothetical protein